MAQPATTTATVEIPLNPKAGEIWFWLDLSLIEDVPETYALVKALGLIPRLAFRRIREEIEICLLLYHGNMPGMVAPPDDLFEREQRILSDAINPESMHFTCGLARVTA